MKYLKNIFVVSLVAALGLFSMGLNVFADTIGNSNTTGNTNSTTNVNTNPASTVNSPGAGTNNANINNPGTGTNNSNAGLPDNTVVVTPNIGNNSGTTTTGTTTNGTITNTPTNNSNSLVNNSGPGVFPNGMGLLTSDSGMTQNNTQNNNRINNPTSNIQAPSTINTPSVNTPSNNIPSNSSNLSNGVLTGGGLSNGLSNNGNSSNPNPSNPFNFAGNLNLSNLLGGGNILGLLILYNHGFEKRLGDINHPVMGNIPLGNSSSVNLNGAVAPGLNWVNGYPQLNGNYLDCSGNIDNDPAHHTVVSGDTDSAHHSGMNCPSQSASTNLMPANWLMGDTMGGRDLNNFNGMGLMGGTGSMEGGMSPMGAPESMSGMQLIFIPLVTGLQNNVQP